MLMGILIATIVGMIVFPRSGIFAPIFGAITIFGPVYLVSLVDHRKYKSKFINDDTAYFKDKDNKTILIDKHGIVYDDLEILAEDIISATTYTYADVSIRYWEKNPNLGGKVVRSLYIKFPTGEAKLFLSYEENMQQFSFE
jgi:hypothetical protein